MKKFKKIAHSDELHIIVNSPFSDGDIEKRHKEYKEKSNIAFKKDYRGYVFTPAVLELDGRKYHVQMNFCHNTFCKWYAYNQKEYTNIKYKPSRYKLQQTKRGYEPEPGLLCNSVPDDNVYGVSLGNYTDTISNWSVAEEIKRLATINTTTPVEPEYAFHKEDYSANDKTPLSHKEQFYNKGKSVSNSIRYQCKECKKTTNVLPSQEESFNYHQKRNDILIEFTKAILGRTPVRRVCENLGIGSKTYYEKLEWVYRKCLEFNQRHETEVLKKMEFDTMWLNTDMMIYNLNNIRMRGKGAKKDTLIKDKKLQTYIIASADLKSGYAF